MDGEEGGVGGGQGRNWLVQSVVQERRKLSELGKGHEDGEVGNSVTTRVGFVGPGD